MGNSNKSNQACNWLFWLLTGIALLLTTPWALNAAGTVVVNIKTQTPITIAGGFSGYNAPQLRNGVEYYDPKFVTAAMALKSGWLRFPAGTSSMAYDWNPANLSGGHINMDWMNSLITGNPAPVTGNPANILIDSQKLTQVKGGVYLSDFATFANALGANAIMCFNGFTDNNPDSAKLMAQAAQSAGLNVVEWELDNEPYVYPLIFPTATSYAMKMYNPYFTGIKSASPGAAIALSIGSNSRFATWNNNLSAFSPRYWNSVSMHYYPITSILSLSSTIQTLNGVLAHGTADYINTYVNPLIGASTPIFITEFSCCTLNNNQFLNFVYNGIFLAEYVARMSAVPNVKAVGINSLYTDNYDYHGLIQSMDDHEAYLFDQLAKDPNYSTNTATDPMTQFQFYTSAPGLAMQVANQAINNSTKIWPTTVTGGPMVPIQGYDGAPIPAVYAQGYKGTDGTHYILITNKSAVMCSTTVQTNGKPVTATLNITTVSSPSASATNSKDLPNAVQIQTSTSANPVSIGPFSVTVVSW